MWALIPPHAADVFLSLVFLQELVEMIKAKKAAQEQVTAKNKKWQRAAGKENTHTHTEHGLLTLCCSLFYN